MDILNYEVLKKEENLTILEWLENFHLSNKTLRDIQANNLLKLNGEIVDFNTKISEYDIISIDISGFEENNFEPFSKELDILYEDEDVLAVNKPRNILVHPDGNTNQTLGNIISNYYLSQGLNRKVRVIQRLDYETTGVIIYPKHYLAHSFLDYELRNQNIKRIYLAICEGKISPRQDTIDKPIGKDRHHNNRYIVYEKGKEARTNYFSLQYKKNYTLVMLSLGTGRTHQIRVHLSHLGHPILGDELYGSNIQCPLMLHSYAIEFMHPRLKQNIRIEAKLPYEFKKVWDEL